MPGASSRVSFLNGPNGIRLHGFESHQRDSRSVRPSNARRPVTHHAAFLILGKIGVEHIADELSTDRGFLADRLDVVGRTKVTKYDLHGLEAVQSVAQVAFVDVDGRGDLAPHGQASESREG